MAYEGFETNPEFTYETYQEQAPMVVDTVAQSGTAVSSINGLGGPAVTLSGGTTGYSFSTAGTTLTLTGAAAAVKETSGPTTLTIGAIADGQFAKRVGATLVGAAPSVSDPIFTETTPAQITSDQNNYNLGTGSFLRLSTDAARTVTGFLAGTAGTPRLIANIGSFNLVLANESASSSAPNRIITGTGADVTLAPDDTAFLIYDGTSQRWRIFA